MEAVLGLVRKGIVGRGRVGVGFVDGEVLQSALRHAVDKEIATPPNCLACRLAVDALAQSSLR